MTKKDIVRTVSERLDLSQPRAHDVVQTTFEALVETLVREGRVELRNFGVFQIKRRQARMARNPRTGEQVAVGPRSVVTFRAGKELEARVSDFDPGETPIAPTSSGSQTSRSDGPGDS